MKGEGFHFVRTKVKEMIFLHFLRFKKIFMQILKWVWLIEPYFNQEMCQHALNARRISPTRTIDYMFIWMKLSSIDRTMSDPFDVGHMEIWFQSNKLTQDCFN
jgi:hypothetical protein